MSGQKLLFNTYVDSAVLLGGGGICFLENAVQIDEVSFALNFAHSEHVRD